MSKNLVQVYAANPITVISDTDLLYVVTNSTDDAGISGADLKAMFAPATGEALTRVNDTNVTLTLTGSPLTALVHATDLALGWTGQLSLLRGGSNAALVASNGGIVYSTASAMAILSGVATAGKVLQSGATAAPTWSTPTYPSASGTAGFILRSNGTNNVYSQSTFADLYAASSILYSNGANNVAGLATANNGVLVTGNTGIPSILAGPAATGRVLTSNAAAEPSWSTATFPSTGGTAGNVLISNGTNYIASTSLWPNTVGSAGKIIRSDGTTNAYSTSTFADTYAINTILYNASANTVSGLPTANSGVLITSSGGVPSISSTLPSGIAATNMALTTPAFTGVPTGTITASTYTPTVTTVANASAAAGGNSMYIRVGNQVQVSGTLTCDAITTATLTQIRISLPIASNIGATGDAGGVLASDVATAAGRIEGEPGSDTVQASFRPVSTANDTYGFTFMYTII